MVNAYQVYHFSLQIGDDALTTSCLSEQSTLLEVWWNVFLQDMLAALGVHRYLLEEFHAVSNLPKA